MTNDAKRKLLVLLLITALMLVLIGGALPQLELKPGIPLPKWGNAAAEAPSASLPTLSLSVNALFKALLDLIIIVVLAFAGYKVIKGVPWKQIAGPALGTIAAIAVVGLLLFALLNLNVTPGVPVPEVLPQFTEVEGPPLGTPPPFLIWLVWLGLAAAVVFVGLQIANRRNRPTPTRDPLTLEVERALESLKIGLDFRNVIVQCYRQMSLVLQQEQGLERADAMTAREFERLLEAKGLPQAPVHLLTQLFEAARYSVQPLTPADEQTAIECLSAIVQASHTRQPSSHESLTPYALG